jgi:hypothetical protein
MDRRLRVTAATNTGSLVLSDGRRGLLDRLLRVGIMPNHSSRLSPMLVVNNNKSDGGSEHRPC